MNHLEVRRKFNRAKQLKSAREYRGISQTDLCKNIKGVSQSALSKFEKGQGNISDEKLKEIFIYLNFPFAFIDVEMGRITYLGDCYHGKNHGLKI